MKDPADVIAGLVDQRASALEAALAAHIVAAAGQTDALEGRRQLSSSIAAAQTTSVPFAEENPYIGPTLDRLDETALVLNDEMNAPAGTPAPAPAPTPAPTPPVTTTLTQLIGPKPKHGKQKSKSYKLGPVSGSAKAGKVLTLSIKLPAAAVTALGKGSKESGTLTVTETNGNGTGRATAKVAMLKGTK